MRTQITNKKLCASVLLAFSLTATYAQQAATATGGDASGTGGSAAYSVGQIDYTTSMGTTVSVAEGVQQPYEISISTGLSETGINLNLHMFPNPATTFLMLQVEQYDKALSYQLFDIGGKLMESNIIATNSTTIKMEHYADATYFLKVFSNNLEVKTFKIIKNK